jgi:glycosyltransferase involved in cell wall biosynthesis
MTKVSVIMGVYNGGGLLRDALASILADGFHDLEVIVVDDGSTDETPEILRAVADPRLKVFRQQNAGLAAALQRGLSAAQGIYIARADADDLSLPGRFEAQSRFLDENPDVDVLATAFQIIDANSKLIATQTLPSGPRIHRALQTGNPICHGSVMMRKEALVGVGGYDPTLRYAQDFDLWLRMRAAGKRFEALEAAYYAHRVTPISLGKTAHQAKYAAYTLARHQGRAVTAPPQQSSSGNGRGRQFAYLYHLGTWASIGGDQAEARHLLLKSIRARPHSARAWYRLMTTLLPIRQRRWLASVVPAARLYLRARRVATRGDE